jgi:hypothetical protein
LNKSKFRPEAHSYLSEFRKDGIKSIGRCPTNQEILRLSLVKNGVSCELTFMYAEIAWESKRKPFFNVHEAVLRSIKNTSLTLKPSVIPKSVVHDLGILCVKFPIGFSEKLLDGIDHFFIFISSNTFEANTGARLSGDSLSFSYQTNNTVHAFGCMMDQNFEEADQNLDKEAESDIELRRRLLVARIGLGVMLLAADPEFIKPVLLKCDQGRKIDLEKLTKRAHQRGLIGYEIGADMEVSPHFRRPHFAIRWTGKGSEIPKLVPVKGAIIHKSKMQEIPTGYEVPF